jgi:hypothetical protein
MIVSTLLAAVSLMFGYDIITHLYAPDWLRMLADAALVVVSIHAADEIRCPRCQLCVFSPPEGKAFVGVEDLRRDCPKCGRDRLFVWPWQYRLKPER